jgi:hypothetical protein
MRTKIHFLENANDTFAYYKENSFKGIAYDAGCSHSQWAQRKEAAAS